MADLSSSESLGETLKIVFIFIVLAVSLFFGYFPLYCKVRRNSHRLLGFFNSFTGGVFMGIGLFLLLPKGKEEMEAYFSSEEHSSDFFKSIPLTFFLAFLSYSFMLLIEKVLFNSPALIPFLSAAEGEVGHSHSHGHEESHSHNEIKASKEEKSQEHVLDEEDSDEDEEAFKNIVSTKGKYGSFMQIRNCKFTILNCLSKNE